jgi:hypothetical protein
MNKTRDSISATLETRCLTAFKSRLEGHGNLAESSGEHLLCPCELQSPFLSAVLSARTEKVV